MIYLYLLLCKMFYKYAVKFHSLYAVNWCNNDIALLFASVKLYESVLCKRSDC